VKQNHNTNNNNVRLLRDWCETMRFSKYKEILKVNEVANSMLVSPSIPTYG